MGVYLGNSGWVEIIRNSIQTGITSVVNPADVNPAQNRVGLDTGTSGLFTGDRVSIRTSDNTPLGFISNWSYASIEAYLAVDEMGGVRLYSDYADAINDHVSRAVPLNAVSADQTVIIVVQNAIPRLLGQITQYELTTSRETIDVTCLSQQFRAQYSAGLISGQGQISCLWEYRDHLCSSVGNAETEWAHYFSNLVVRTDLGSAFSAAFVLKASESAPLGASASQDAILEALVYESECVVTNVALAIEPTEFIRSTISFVTTGPIRMRLRPAPREGLLLREEISAPIALELRDGRLRP